MLSKYNFFVLSLPLNTLFFLIEIYFEIQSSFTFSIWPNYCSIFFCTGHSRSCSIHLYSFLTLALPLTSDFLTYSHCILLFLICPDIPNVHHYYVKENKNTFLYTAIFASFEPDNIQHTTLYSFTSLCMSWGFATCVFIFSKYSIKIEKFIYMLHFFIIHV